MSELFMEWLLVGLAFSALCIVAFFVGRITRPKKTAPVVAPPEPKASPSPLDYRHLFRPFDPKGEVRSRIPLDRARGTTTRMLLRALRAVSEHREVILIAETHNIAERHLRTGLIRMAQQLGLDHDQRLIRAVTVKVSVGSK